MGDTFGSWYGKARILFLLGKERFLEPPLALDKKAKPAQLEMSLKTRTIKEFSFIQLLNPDFPRGHG